MNERDLAALATGSHGLQAYPAEHVLHAMPSGRVFTVGDLSVMKDGSIKIFARCPNGHECWLTAEQYGRLVYLANDAQARAAATRPMQRAARVGKDAAQVRASRLAARVDKLAQSSAALDEADAEARASRKATRDALTECRRLAQPAVMRERWLRDPRGTALACLAALGCANPTPDQIKHAIARAGF